MTYQDNKTYKVKRNSREIRAAQLIRGDCVKFAHLNGPALYQGEEGGRAIFTKSGESFVPLRLSFDPRDLSPDGEGNIVDRTYNSARGDRGVKSGSQEWMCS